MTPTKRADSAPAAGTGHDRQAPDAGFAEYLATPEGPQFLNPDAVRSPGPVVPIRTVAADGRHGPVGIRIYGEPGAPGSPGLVWLHGGGFVSGSIDSPESDYLARVLAARGTPVLSVDYRLARNGVSFPVPHDDTLAGWFWARKNAGSLGLDPDLLCLGGAGAGGNLAVGAALYLVDAGKPLPAKLLLAYPFLDAELPAPAGGLDDEAMAGLPRHLRFTLEDCIRTAENYVGGPVSMAPSYAMPGYADPAGLPPAALLACEYDDARGSTEQFASALERAGVPVSYFLAEGAVHGHLNHTAGLPEGQAALEFLAGQLAAVRRP
ncbi:MULTISPECIES: alpha/beta hydrolase [unclassified Pseudarthrobacter]|uniref:alpha/beta hydrolase n=1 Tax=unclassified Pseudarthrobacter TaxID=2647000 RepID=UPI00113017C6|nr:MULTISPECIES: alpha/beta hydrolase [unclassified Pseudarthrobacter]QDG61457.1 alpha/beta hydrolase [Pseudarthrobacter sp. NIBRBAC000502771]QDG90464.1 alpha/beta hydrolase [Pseudarthrobacter sp. NIBRBAC000502770]